MHFLNTIGYVNVPVLIILMFWYLFILINIPVLVILTIINYTHSYVLLLICSCF